MNDSLFPWCPDQLFCKLISGLRIQAWQQEHYVWFRRSLLSLLQFCPSTLPPSPFWQSSSQIGHMFCSIMFSHQMVCLNDKHTWIDRVVKIFLSLSMFFLPQEINILWEWTFSNLFCCAYNTFLHMAGPVSYRLSWYQLHSAEFYNFILFFKQNFKLVQFLCQTWQDSCWFPMITSHIYLHPLLLSALCIYLECKLLGAGIQDCRDGKRRSYTIGANGLADLHGSTGWLLGKGVTIRVVLYTPWQTYPSLHPGAGPIIATPCTCPLPPVLLHHVPSVKNLSILEWYRW